MNRFVVVSANDNPDYYQYIPYVCKAWNKLGWKVICFLRGNEKTFESIIDGYNHFFYLEGKSEYRDETLVQVSRLFAAYCFNGLIMTADGDMMPCSNYWQPNEDEITCYGHDLTGGSHYPICYIAMSSDKWKTIMEITDEDLMIQIERLLDKYEQAKSDNWEQWWQVDQDIITEKLRKENINSILRGFDNKFGFLAKGRIDRYNWNETLNIENPIDAHMPRPFNEEAANLILNKYANT
jgi:hypothetical protein